MPISATTGPVAVPTYNSPLVSVCNGNFYVGYPGAGQPTLAGNQSTPPLRTDVLVSMCFLNLAVYAVDGLNITTLSLKTGNVTPFLHNVTPQTIATPAAATLGQTTGGSIGTSQLYYVRIAYTRETGEVALSGEDSFTVSANHRLTVASPSSSADVTGYYVYVGAGTGTETLQSGPVPIAIGTDWTMPATGLVPANDPFPVGFVPPDVCFCCNWRGRLVLAGDSNNPQNFYMSRVGVPTDFNYAALDPAAAVAGNLSESGQIGEPIIALMPYTDDYFLIGCSNSMWMLQGDPADGGSIVRVSDQMGMTGPNAWCVAPDGTLYFIARGGLYNVKPIWEFYKPPELVSGDTYDQYFQQIINDQYYISLEWDVDSKYMHIFATPTDDATVGTHLIFDSRNGGLWPQQYQLAHGPTASCRYAANAVSGERAILLGGWDGVVRQFTLNALNDDGSAIVSHAVLGPIKPQPEAALFSGITIDFGEVAPGDTEAANWNGTVVLNAGPDAYSVTEGTPHSTAIILGDGTDRRQKTFRQRFRGGWFSVMIENGMLNKYWSFESALLEFIVAGKNRERR